MKTLYPFTGTKDGHESFSLLVPSLLSISNFMTPETYSMFCIFTKNIIMIPTDYQKKTVKLGKQFHLTLAISLS